MGHFWPKTIVSSYVLICLKNFFETLHGERDQEMHGNYINSFLKKFSFGENGSKMVRPHNSESTFRVFLIFCIMKGTKRYMEFILMVFLKNFLFEVNGPF